MSPASRHASQPSRRTALRTLLAAGVGVVSGGAAHGYLYERHRIGLTRRTLATPMLPSALEGLRLALLTDFHASAMVADDDIAEAVRLAIRERPDLVVLGGDYVSFMDRRYVETCAGLLAPLHAPHGVFAVLGNHDEGALTIRALGRGGIPVLRDARTTLTVRGEKIELIGLDFWTRRTADLTRLLRGATGYTILLAHDPRRFAQAAALNVPLMLSGHTHGGQIVLPGLGAVAARRFPVAAGALSRENTTLFVSRGIGTVYVPCRVNCPPEVALLTLTRSRDRARSGAGG